MPPRPAAFSGARRAGQNATQRNCVAFVCNPSPGVQQYTEHIPSTPAKRVSFRRNTSGSYGCSDAVVRTVDDDDDDDDPPVDRLRSLADVNYNINVHHGQTSQHLDSLFLGGILGKVSDIGDGSLRYNDFRTYNNIQGDYFIADRFLWKVAMHLAKNYLAQKGCLPGVRVPLILGIWGPKGTGKTFQTELSFRKMKVKPIIMSAGELESEVAGAPGRLIRERYRRASEVSRVNGTMGCLMINDLDAGIGHFQETQITVNNQIVVASLMNLCDDPERVSTGDEWRDNDKLNRVPIIVTGNDFSTLFAPLVRDGRMDKFYWEPVFDEKVSMVYQMYRDDAVGIDDIATLIARFEHQPLDFFGALRSSMYDNQILEWIRHDVMKNVKLDTESNLQGLGRRLVRKENLPEFEAVPLTVEMLIREGQRLEFEQQMVMEHRLSDVYMRMGETEDPAPPSLLEGQGDALMQVC